MFICNKKDSTYQIDNLAADFKTMVKSQKEFHDSMKCLSNGIKSDVIALRAMHDTERRKCNDTTNSFLLHHFDRIMQVIDELRVVVYGAVGSTIAVVPPPIEIANNNVSAYPLSCERSEGKLPRSTPYRPGHKIPVHPHIGNFAATERNGLTIQLGQGEASSKQDNNFDITTDAGRAKLKQHFQRSQQELKDNKDLGSQKSQKSRTDEENTEPSDKRTESVPGHQEWKDTKGRSESEVGVVTSLRYNDILTERNKGLKRVLVPGRGWVGSKRLQDEVQQYGRNGFVRKFD
ncbi:uncharacterized protein RJT20DRAFT_2610 [Scheffersomyces xylosifermentans]|uniref:uncharacterized protein n=1 Tax=Scheffersomyces xylosifermentans TaxID=1304137 RepID=UPI00315C8807